MTTTGTDTTRRMSGAERREQLLDATKAIVDERGFHAASIEAVAREAGITRPVVYGHFGDLDGLLEALVERESARALAGLAEILPPVDPAEGDPRDALVAALDGYLRAVEADPPTWRLVLMPSEGAPASLREHIDRGRDAVVAHLADVVRPGLAPGREPPDPELAARGLSAFADELARRLLTDPESYPRARLLAFARWILDSIVAPPEPLPAASSTSHAGAAGSPAA
jgi:AcrR family transcriptional regulator